MRLDALRDEELRKKEQGLPGFATLETMPLTAAVGDDYGYNQYQHQHQQQQMPGALRRDGSVVNGVGVGYGRRTPGGSSAAAAHDPYHTGGSPWDPHGGGGYGGNAGLVPPQAARRLSGSDGMSMSGMTVSNAGQAGLGAGGAGVEQPGYGYYAQQQQQYGQGPSQGCK